MGDYRHSKRIVLLLLALGIAGIANSAFAQGTAFTYQGRLQDGGTNANGAYDFQFTLWDSLNGGTQQPQPSPASVLKSAVSVVNGVFTVQIDFGPSAFPGADRFLETSVRPAGGGSFTLLSPRQPMTSTPYAVRSALSGNADVAATATNATQLGGVAANQYVVTTDTRLSDSRAPTGGSANYIQNGAAQQAASNFNISGDGTAGGTLSAPTVNAVTQYNLGGIRVLFNPGTDNLFAGAAAGQSTMTGSTTTGAGNAFFGAQAGPANTTGAYNSFFGSYAGQRTTTGTHNTILGIGAGFVNITGTKNTLVGAFAETGADNLTNATAIGAHARVNASNSLVLGSILGINAAPADTNVGIGTTIPTERLHVVGNGLFTGNLTVNGNINAPSFASQFIQNTLVQQATSNFSISGNGTAGGTLSANIVNGSSQYNIGGSRVLFAPANNIAVGIGAGPATFSGGENSYYGFIAGAGSNATSNSFFGATTGYGATGSYNSFFGAETGASSNATVSGSGNAFFGFRTGWLTTTGGNNTFLGAQAGQSNNTGSLNVMVGFDAGLNNVSGTGNTFVGAIGGTNTTGSYNSLFGYGADMGGSAFSRSTAIGFGASVAQSDSIVIGGIAGINGVATDASVGIGTTTPVFENARFSVVQRVPNMFSQIVKTTGLSSGTSFGLNIRAGTSQSDVALDVYDQAVSNELFVVRGDGNIGMGFNRSSLGTARVNIDNPTTALYAHSTNGYGLQVRSETTHAIYVDGSSYFNRWIVLNELLGGGGTPLCRNSSNQVSSCSSSSIRYKKNIGSFDYGLDVVQKLRPITFDWKLDGTHDIGLVAEEVEKVAPQLSVYEKGRVEGVKYDKLGVVLINAIKEQQALIEQQQAQLKQQAEHIKRTEDAASKQRAALAAQRQELNALKKIVCRSHPRGAVCR